MQSQHACMLCPPMNAPMLPMHPCRPCTHACIHPRCPPMHACSISMPPMRPCILRTHASYASMHAPMHAPHAARAPMSPMCPCMHAECLSQAVAKPTPASKPPSSHAPFPRWPRHSGHQGWWQLAFGVTMILMCDHTIRFSRTFTKIVSAQWTPRLVGADTFRVSPFGRITLCSLLQFGVTHGANLIFWLYVKSICGGQSLHY